MKITKLILKNFSAIKNAMNAYEVEIDFSNSVNKICLLIGPNGCGKTTILSLMTPFADIGNLDVRNGNEMILPDKEGYKEIHIRTDESKYIIKHFYSPHKGKSHSVKSYIEKDGTELNVNGNVGSFKDLVSIELQIEPEYLKLIRLGSNVTSLIGLTSTERKNFMSKIMSDIGIFLEYYKSVNTKLRQLDDMISHDVDKLNRLGILDKKEHKKEIKEIELLIDKLQKDYIEGTNTIAILNNEINKIEDSSSLKDNLKAISKKYDKMNLILEKKDSIESTDVSFYNKKINELEKLIAINETEFNNNFVLIENSLSHLNTLQEQLRSYEVQLRKEQESDKEIQRMEDGLSTLRLKLREYENILGDYKPLYTKEELESFIIFLKNTQNIISTTYEFGKKPMERVIKLMSEKKNVQNYINSHLIDLDEQSGDSTTLFINKLASLINGSNEKIIYECKSECDAKKLYVQIKNILETSEVTDKNEDSQFYRDMDLIHQNLILVLPRFAEYKSTIDKFPDDIKKSFELPAIYDHLRKLEFIYDTKLMNDLLSLSTEYDAYIKLMNLYEDESEKIGRFATLSNYTYVKGQVDTLTENVENERKKISSLKESNISLVEERREYERTLETYEEIKETLERYDEVKSLFERYSKEYEIYQESVDKIQEVSMETSKMKIQIDDLTTKLQNKISDLDQYEVLMKEISKFNFIYDEMKYTKDAVSAKSGIPIYIENGYLQDTTDITNELLDIAYNGNIYIKKFNITPTEFSIPFINKGIELSDVKFSSQGELSFLSIALSFALASHSLSKYNIMLLDEIDGPLDENNREKFIAILENQIDRINSEQNFLITHNNMFYSYPVDIIDLSFNNTNRDKYPMANFIDIIRS